jgi:hypothetical protein
MNNSRKGTLNLPWFELIFREDFRSTVTASDFSHLVLAICQDGVGRKTEADGHLELCNSLPDSFV